MVGHQPLDGIEATDEGKGNSAELAGICNGDHLLCVLEQNLLDLDILPVVFGQPCPGIDRCNAEKQSVEEDTLKNLCCEAADQGSLPVTDPQEWKRIFADI